MRLKKHLDDIKASSVWDMRISSSCCTSSESLLDYPVLMAEEHLVDNAAKVGAFLIDELKGWSRIKEVRGRGLMIGLEFDEPIKEIRQRLLFDEKVFTGVAGTNTIRLLPPLCLSQAEAECFLERFGRVLKA